MRYHVYYRHADKPACIDRIRDTHRFGKTVEAWALRQTVAFLSRGDIVFNEGGEAWQLTETGLVQVPARLPTVEAPAIAS